MNKKGQLITGLFFGLAALFVIVLVYALTSGVFQKISDDFNESYTTDREHSLVTNINNSYKWGFIILGAGIIVIMIISALLRQTRETYL